MIDIRVKAFKHPTSNILRFEFNDKDKALKIKINSSNNTFICNLFHRCCLGLRQSYRLTRYNRFPGKKISIKPNREVEEEDEYKY